MIPVRKKWYNLLPLSLLCCLAVPALAVIDQNGNQQSDIWELQFNAIGLAPNADADLDGFSNREESIAGTDPFDPQSLPSVNSIARSAAATTNRVLSVAGKRYTLHAAESLGDWTAVTNGMGAGGPLALRAMENAEPVRFFRVAVSDVDSDGDSLTDYEELAVGFDPKTTHTERFDETDNQRFTAAAYHASSTVTVSVLDADCYERWPDPGVVAIRRPRAFKPITVNFSIGGTATRGADYSMPPGTSIVMQAGVREVWLSFEPIADALDGEPTETIIVTLQPGAGYVIGATTSATVNLHNETATSLPNPKSAARFLIQASFGPHQDDPNDADLIPENVEEVMAMGFDAWIEDQFTRPEGWIKPFTQYALTIPQFYTDPKEAAWWNRAMGVPSLVPGGPTQLPDPLRQRLAFALSQIVVVSDRPETLAVVPVGMADYYDMLVSHAFGNYRDVLFDVTMHPVMGFYLSHVMNRAATNNIFPDENYAREIMQLFSIGLWELNQDGTRRLSTNGLPIPTYDNSHITEFARVFTGLSYGPETNTSFGNAPQNFTTPMKPWDAYHDCGPKTLLNGYTLPARTPGPIGTGTATLLDINAAIDHLFHHTNVAPFIGRQLIQRFVTSNPSTGYVARVAAAFNDNGSGVRGDLKAVIKAVLLDPEARDPSFLSDPTFGKQREPFLRAVNLAHAFNASAPAGFYALNDFFAALYEEPMKSPSVFNFYLPGYLPPGALANAGLHGPEFQILNAGSAISGPNYFFTAVRDSLHRQGMGTPAWTVKLDLAPELALVNDPNTLVRRVDLALTGGMLPPREFQIVREAVERIPTSTWEWEKERVWMALYLVVTSPEFCVMR